MRHSDQPIRNIEDALRFLSKRKGSIRFDQDQEINRATAMRLKIIGEDELRYQNDHFISNAEIDNASFDILTHYVCRLAEEIRRSDAASPVAFQAPEKP